MTNFSILYANDLVICFAVEYEIYFLLYGRDNLRLYDANGNAILCPNIDNWIQAKTHQRLSARSLVDIGIAYKKGLDDSYNVNDLEKIVESTILSTINEIMHNYLSEYSLVYWIEVSPPDKIEAMLKSIRSNFDIIRKTMGNEGLSNELSRIYNYCVNRQPHNAEVALKLLSRMSTVPAESKCNKANDLNREVVMNVKSIIRKQLGHLYKNVNDDIVSKANKISKYKY